MQTYLEAKKEQLVCVNSTILVAKVLESGNAVIDGYKTCMPDWSELLGNEKLCEQLKDTIVHIPEKDILSINPRTSKDYEGLSEIMIRSEADVMVERVSTIKAKNLKSLKPSDCGSGSYYSDNKDEIGVSHNKIIEIIVSAVVGTLVARALNGPSLADQLADQRKKRDKFIEEHGEEIKELWF